VQENFKVFFAHKIPIVIYINDPTHLSKISGILLFKYHKKKRKLDVHAHEKNCKKEKAF
jgi:hypothetical protein